LSLENVLEEKEQELKKTQSTKFKLWFAGRLLWTYIKSVLGFFIPNALVLVIAGSLIGIVTPNNVPKEWINTWIPMGWIFVLIFGGSILCFIYAAFKVPLFQWLLVGIVFGVFCAIPYLLTPSDDPTVFYYFYAVFTLAVVPFTFMFRRALIIWEEIRSLPSTISLLKQQIKEKEAFRETMKKKGLVPFVNRYGEEKWGTPSQVEEWKRIDIGLKNRFADYSPREFEKFVAKLFSEMGYQVSLGPYVGDYGADIIAHKDNRRVLIQVKKYFQGKLVGNREVRDTLGAVWNKADKAILITTSDFTEQAYEQAKGAPIELWNYRALEKYIEKYLVKATDESASKKESTKVVEEENETDVYREAYPELSEEEAELQETQEIDMDFEDEEDCTHQVNCRHLNVMQIPVFHVGGETRRVVKKCADCGKILETQNIGR